MDSDNSNGGIAPLGLRKNALILTYVKTLHNFASEDGDR